MNLSSTERRLLTTWIMFNLANGEAKETLLVLVKNFLPKCDEKEVSDLVEYCVNIYNHTKAAEPIPTPQKTDKYQNLYDYVLANLGTNNIKFETQVSKEEFKTYLYNYPRKYESNNFMGWCDFYDFADKKDGEAHWNYCIARHYYDYGADDYYLPTIPKE